MRPLQSADLGEAQRNVTTEMEEGIDLKEPAYPSEGGMKMRKSQGAEILWVLLLAFLFIAMLSAGAETASTGDQTGDVETVAAPLNEPAAQAPYTLDQIATIPGAIAATLLIVQYLKFPLDKVWKIPTRFLVLMIALLLLGGAQAMVRGLTWSDVPLVVINAFVVALAAMGAYEVSFKKLKP